MLSTKNGAPEKTHLVFQKTCFKVELLKTFKKRRPALKIPSTVIYKTIIRCLNFLQPLVRLWRIIQACLSFICLVAHNPGTTMVIVQSKLVLLLCKLYWLLYAIFFFSQRISVFTFPFKAAKSVNYHFVSRFAISIASSGRRGPVRIHVYTCAFSVQLHKVSLITWYFPWWRCCSFP